jgi:hypothetical protein
MLLISLSFLDVYGWQTRVAILPSVSPMYTSQRNAKKRERLGTVDPIFMIARFAQ